LIPFAVKEAEKQTGRLLAGPLCRVKVHANGIDTRLVGRLRVVTGLVFKVIKPRVGLRPGNDPGDVGVDARLGGTGLTAPLLRFIAASRFLLLLLRARAFPFSLAPSEWSSCSHAVSVLGLPARLASAATTTAAAAVAAKATAATAAATATKAAAATAAGFLGSRFIDGESPPTELRLVELGNRLLRTLVSGHFHEAESTRAAGRHVTHDGHGLHGADFLEQLLKILLRRGVGKIPHVQLPTHRLLLVSLRENALPRPVRMGRRPLAVTRDPIRICRGGTY
jgi:hypothetical protein